MAAPIKHTCPDIDKITKKLTEQMKWVRKFKDYDDPKSCEDMLDECFDVMEDADAAFEDLRSSNDVLRQWGEELDKELSNAADQIYELEQKIEELTARYVV